MARTSIAIGIVLAALAGPAVAQPAPTTDPAIAKLEKSLPSGWTLLSTDSELVIRHDKPCYLTGQHAAVKGAAVVEGPLVTLQLRYRIEPKWTPKQLAAAKDTNEKLAAELAGAAVKYQIDAIHKTKGAPLPANADEKARLDAYEKERGSVAARLVRLPLCTLGSSSLFDGDDTYAQLSLQVDPPEATQQGRRIVELVKQQCGG